MIILNFVFIVLICIIYYFSKVFKREFWDGHKTEKRVMIKQFYTTLKLYHSTSKSIFYGNPIDARAIMTRISCSVPVRKAGVKRLRKKTEGGRNASIKIREERVIWIYVVFIQRWFSNFFLYLRRKEITLATEEYKYYIVLTNKCSINEFLNIASWKSL